jgi:hypothetical protein
VVLADITGRIGRIHPERIAQTLDIESLDNLRSAVICCGQLFGYQRITTLSRLGCRIVLRIAFEIILSS